MRSILILTAIIALLQTLPGCAARREARAKLPTAETVCLSINGISEPGLSFAKRKAAPYLAEEGFRLVESGCDLTVTYTTFNHDQWRMIRQQGLLGTKSSNAWSIEGIASLNRGSTTIVEDKRIDLRDYATMQDLLDDLASELVEIVGEHYRPVSPPTKR